MVNNDQREIKWLPVLRAGVQRPQKTRSTTSDFSRYRTPLCDKKGIMSGSTKPCYCYLHCVAQLLKTILRHKQLELLDNANGCKHSKQ